MSKEGSEHIETFLWENQTWVFSNLDNNNDTGNNNSGGRQQKSSVAETKKLQVSRTNSQTDQGTTSLKKRGGRGGQVQRNSTSKGSEDSDEANNKEDGDRGGDGGGGGGGESDHEIHIWTERERRKKMRNMFANLQALLPQLPSKVDKSTIVDEAVNYIKTLEQTLEKLQKQKLERAQGGTTFCYEPSMSMIAPEYVAETREAFLADQGIKSSNNLTNILATKSPNVVLPSRYHHPVQFQTWTSSNVVLNICGEEAQISVCSSKKPGLFTTICYTLEKHNIEMISAHVSSDCNQIMYMIQAQVRGASDKFTETIPVEEIYRQAAGEIMCWVSP
ncbi:hypothetical protein JCGZ_14785 [Jatropha curcas]|uniref:BHLH domain-containing protein n=1 Tax=Jatropha curcas TaxID=180498 RepID=A0A067KKD7_JATCU|nr:transcription factor bHLH95 [Jatropha curcas]KDP32264.1 hypothetical protein JCGZ_14785 [Jatropha curcas]